MRVKRLPASNAHTFLDQLEVAHFTMASKEEAKGESLPLSSVEVIASVSDDGTIRTRSVSTMGDRVSSSLVDSCDALEQPTLVPVESSSDSDSSDGEVNAEESEAMIVVSSSKDVAIASDGGMYDCLSDQFSNLFCPVDHQAQSAQRSAMESTMAENQQIAISCAEVGCTDYQLDDLFNSANDGTDVFGSLQFWLSPSQEEKLKGSTTKKPQNRSSSRKRRAAHIQRIWSDWHAEKVIPVVRSKSLTDDLCPFEEEDDDIFYDSDPEQEHQEKHVRAKTLNEPKRPVGFRFHRPQPIQTIYEDHCFHLPVEVPPTPRHSAANQTFDFYPRHDSFSTHQANGPPRPCHSPQGPAEFDMMMQEDDDSHLARFVQEATNTRIPLVWHRRTKMDSSSALPPVAVTGAFEVGTHLDNLVVQPKFTWSRTHEPDLEKRKIGLSGAEPNNVELLSIIRVVKPGKLNKGSYPFARLDRTCCITTNDEEFPFLVLEAPSQRERDWLVNALKMIVARLASIIIVRDEAMLLEFFTPYAALMHMDDDSSDDQLLEEREDGPTLDPTGELQLVSTATPVHCILEH